jgi:hypothetical protein
MTREEIEKHLQIGVARQVCVDIRLEPHLPGYVRCVRIHKHARVSLEFEPHGLDEGGLNFIADLHTLEQAIVFLETFLGTPLSSWQNFTTTGAYPERPPSVASSRTWEDVQRIARSLVPRDPAFVWVEQ